MGIFTRLRNAFARVFRAGPPTEPPPEHPPGPGGGGFFDDDAPGAPTGVDNWFIMATWDGPGTKQRYMGPTDLDRLSAGGQVIVAYRDPDTGFLTYRAIIGPFPNDVEGYIDDQIRIHIRRVSPL